MQIHILREDENLEDVSYLYKISKEEIISANGIYDEHTLKEGKMIVIPLKENIEFVKNHNGLIEIKNLPEKKKKKLKIYGMAEENHHINTFIYCDRASEYIDNFIVPLCNTDEGEDYALKAVKLNNKTLLGFISVLFARNIEDLSINKYENLLIYDENSKKTIENSVAFNVLYENLFISSRNFKSDNKKSAIFMYNEDKALSLDEFIDMYLKVFATCDKKNLIAGVSLKYAGIDDLKSGEKEFWDEDKQLAYFEEGEYFENPASLTAKLKFLSSSDISGICFLGLNRNVPYIKYIIKEIFF